MRRTIVRLVQWMQRDWMLKVLALVIATGLWYVVTRQNLTDTMLEVSVQYRLKNPRMVILRGIQKVNITVRGPASILQNLTPEQFSIFIPIDQQKPGERIIHLVPEMVHSRIPGIQILHIRPAELTLFIDLLTTKTVPVQPQFVGTPAPGFQLTDVRVEPGQVRVEGPASLADRVHAAFTEPVNIHMRRQSFHTIVQVGVPHPEWRVIDPQQVDLQVTIEEITEPVKVTLIVETEGLPSGWTVQPRTVVGTFWVPRSKRAVFDTFRPRAIVRWLEGDRPKHGLELSIEVVFPEEIGPFIKRWSLSQETVTLIRQRRRR